MQSASEFQLSSDQLFTKVNRAAAPNGVLDPRLGISDKVGTCETCGFRQVDCAGHFGFVRLELPCFHIGYFKHTLTVLQCICKTCASVLLDEHDKLTYLKRLRNPKLTAHRKGDLFKAVSEPTLPASLSRSLLSRRCAANTGFRRSHGKRSPCHALSLSLSLSLSLARGPSQIIKKCKKGTRCFTCGAVNSTVKKVVGAGSLKLVHEKYKGKLGEELMSEFQVRHSRLLCSRLSYDIVTDRSCCRKKELHAQAQTLMSLEQWKLRCINLASAASYCAHAAG